MPPTVMSLSGTYRDPAAIDITRSCSHTRNTRRGQLPLSLKAKLNQTVLTWEFPVC